MKPRTIITSIGFLSFFVLLTVGIWAKKDICAGIGFIGTGILIGVWQIFHNAASMGEVNWIPIITASIFDVIIGITYLL